MCGIFGGLLREDVVPLLIEGLKALEYRGYDSAGIVVVSSEGLKRRRVQGKIKDLEKHVKSNPVYGNYGLGHTRWATHGRPNENNAHPHVDCSGQIAVVHNGIIENYAWLKEKLSGENHLFRTETDTEVIVHLVEKYLSSSLEEAVRKATFELEGSYAFACISTKDPGKIVLVRHGPPAVVGLADNALFISSDIVPLLKHTNRIVHLDDGEMAILSQNNVKFSCLDGRLIVKQEEIIDWSPAKAEKRGFPHFMLKEINEQPEVVRDTLSSSVAFESGDIYFKNVKFIDKDFEKISRVVFVACGTSYHAALIGKFLLETLGRVQVDVEYASELRSRDYIIDRSALIIGVSQSGETADTLAALRILKPNCFGLLAVTNNVSSTMARESDGVINTLAGPEIGVAATKTFMGQLTALTLFALYFAQRKGTVGRERSFELVSELQRLPSKVERILSRTASIESLAHRLLDCGHYLYLGRWLNFPIALEGALKLKEISYTHAEGYAGGEMKHGPIAMIDDVLTTIAILPQDRVYQKMRSNVSEVRARNGRVVAIAFDDDSEIVQLVDSVLAVPRTNELLTPFLTVVPLQLLAYFLANLKGHDVDQPRNLAKSVTVE